MEKLLEIQAELKAPKDLENTFGRYKYRSCETILEAVKPLIKKHGLILTLSDEMVSIGTRIYVKATATLEDGKKIIKTITAFAREEETKKGMDASQITGAASSYARKYALNGLFLIDDNKDSDETNKGEISAPQRKTEQTHAEPAKTSPQATEGHQKAVKTAIGKVKDISEPNKGGFINITLEGYQKENGRDMQFGTRDKITIETITQRKEEGEKVGVEYTINDNPNYASSIVGLVSVKEEIKELPF